MPEFPLGLIEGFYGRQWSWTERHAMAGFLAEAGYSHYLYAPKGDAALRRLWQEPFSLGWRVNIEAFAFHCGTVGLKWGLGLSPMGLQAEYGPQERARLQRKMAEICALEPDFLWVLFDDMRGDYNRLARNQCAVVADISSAFSGELAVCPSYYSEDPILDEVFGQRPDGYLRELSQGIDADIDLLWTGPRVLSPTLTAADCERFGVETGRKPLLWDNYPVNDGARTSRFLHLDAFRGREPALQTSAKGHFVNPMNQTWLSRIPLASLPALYRARENYDPDVARSDSFDQLPDALRSLLSRDWSVFQREGLDAFDEARRAGLMADYEQLNHPAAREVVAWLGGDYAFDPDCLTD